MAPAKTTRVKNCNNLKTINGKTPDQVNRRNARERKRVEQINNGYRDLAHRLSMWPPLKNKKISKVETLRCAVQYIKHLQELLDYGDSTITINDTEYMLTDDINDQMSPISITSSEHNISSSSSTSSTISSIDNQNIYQYYSNINTRGGDQLINNNKIESPNDYSNIHHHNGYDSGYPSPNYQQQQQQMYQNNNFYGQYNRYQTSPNYHNGYYITTNM